jgi:hypothetical protein
MLIVKKLARYIKYGFVKIYNIYLKYFWYDEYLTTYNSRQGEWFLLFATVSRMAVGPTHPPIEWSSGPPSPGVKPPALIADHSHPSSAEVKNAWSYASTHPYVFMAWCLIRQGIRLCGVTFQQKTLVLNRSTFSPCHHGMARPRVADGGDSLQIWRAAANILNIQPRKADSGGPPASGLDERLTAPHHKKPACYEMLHRASDLNGFFVTT